MLELVTCEGDDSADTPSGRQLLSIEYAVDEIDSCSACYAALVPAVQRLKEEGLLDGLKHPIGIGQGHRGKTGAVGVGDCTKAFAVSIPGCPPKEEEIYRGLKEYLRNDGAV